MGDARSRVVARTIKFAKDDLRTAEAIQAGLIPTQQAVQANQKNIQTNKEAIAANRKQIETNQQDIETVNKRFSDLTEFDTKYTATVYFRPVTRKSQPQTNRPCRNSRVTPYPSPDT